MHFNDVHAPDIVKYHNMKAIYLSLLFNFFLRRHLCILQPYPNSIVIHLPPITFSSTLYEPRWRTSFSADNNSPTVFTLSCLSLHLHKLNIFSTQIL